MRDSVVPLLSAAPDSPSLPPCLLTMPGYGGTLAAVRTLGEAGVPVTVAGSELLAPARWSRYVRRSLRCPDPRKGEPFYEWLVRFGEREPGHFLYPTSDDLAWLFASRAAELGKHFLLFQPPLSTVVTLLDKKRLYAACREVDIETLPTWFPDSLDEVARLAPELPLPLVIKPRTQVRLSTGNHGTIVEAREELVERYRKWLLRDRYLPGLELDFGDLSAPMLQAFVAAGSEGVYSVSGFVDRSGELIGARAARKVLQRPRRVGVGLCFEAAPVRQEAVEGIVRLCRR
ncbi:MAG TPA: carbamoyl-phosphate synthase, partial [Myxococcaceae bacterium]|nr:carbamoyl-phosphate synthase [Myxococcaceae bacterium]